MHGILSNLVGILSGDYAIIHSKSIVERPVGEGEGNILSNLKPTGKGVRVCEGV